MLAKAYKDGFAYSGEWCPTRQRRFGSTSAGVPADRFVVFIQNHDQVGNRPGGERLASLAGFEALKTAAAGYLLSPYVPMLFMGEEWGETNPFLFFVNHSDPALLDAVREGRRKDFGFPEGGGAPDPAAEEAFTRSKIAWERRLNGTGLALWRYYQALLALRKSHPALRSRRKEDLDVTFCGPAYALERWNGGARFWCALNFGAEPTRLELPAGGAWRKALDSADARWDGPGSGAPDSADGGSAVAAAPMSALAYERLEGVV
jgi:maltooligosyltrehalose trehalohydrolase